MDTNDINPRGIGSPVKLSGKESSAETRAPKTNSFYQVQNKVYTRRKVLKQAYSTRKYTGPLSESIICTNSGDDYAPDLFATEELHLFQRVVTLLMTNHAIKISLVLQPCLKDSPMDCLWRKLLLIANLK